MMYLGGIVKAWTNGVIKFRTLWEIAKRSPAGSTKIGGNLLPFAELTDTDYFVHPTGIQTLKPWVSKLRHCIFALR